MPDEAATTSPPAEAAGPRELLLTEESVRCESEAEPISLAIKGAGLVDLLPLFTAVSGLPVRSEVEVGGTLVTLDAQSVPWDCILSAIAERLDLRVELEADEIVLRPIE